MAVDRGAANVAPCTTWTGHMLHLLFFGSCGCWAEGRNRHPYWGWKGDTEDADA